MLRSTNSGIATVRGCGACSGPRPAIGSLRVGSGAGGGGGGGGAGEGVASIGSPPARSTTSRSSVIVVGDSKRRR